MFRKKILRWMIGIIIGSVCLLFLFLFDIPIRPLSKSDDFFNLKNRVEELERYVQNVHTSKATSKHDLVSLEDDLSKNNKLVSNCSYELIILVTSHASNLARRQLIRNTWGTNKIGMRKTFFVVGSWNVSLSNESNIYNDLIVSKEKEDFYNLVPKIKVSFKWVTKYCKFRYLLKTDDDVFVSIPRLSLFLNDPRTPKTELYTGFVNYKANVQHKGRYDISDKEYGKKVYPRYCSGGGFVVSWDAAKKFVQFIDKIKFIKIDDAFVGEVALKAGIDVYHDENFRMYEHLKKDKCKYDVNTIVHHPVKTKACMQTLYSKIKTM